MSAMRYCAHVRINVIPFQLFNVRRIDFFFKTECTTFSWRSQRLSAVPLLVFRQMGRKRMHNIDLRGNFQPASREPSRVERENVVQILHGMMGISSILAVLMRSSHADVGPLCHGFFFICFLVCSLQPS